MAKSLEERHREQGTNSLRGRAAKSLGASHKLNSVGPVKAEHEGQGETALARSAFNIKKEFPRRLPVHMISK